MSDSMEFTFTVYSRRWEHTDTYRLVKNDKGWNISHLAINGQSKPDGDPILFRNFEQDYINYPSGVGPYLEFIWGELDNQTIAAEQAQVMLQQLADWVSSCEKSTPKWDGWN